jgi:hypothetical protein
MKAHRARVLLSPLYGIAGQSGQRWERRAGWRHGRGESSLTHPTLQFNNPLSSSGLTRRPSIPETPGFNRTAAAYWIIRFRG